MFQKPFRIQTRRPKDGYDGEKRQFCKPGQSCHHRGWLRKVSKEEQERMMQAGRTKVEASVGKEARVAKKQT